MAHQKGSTRLDFLSPLSQVPGLGKKRIEALKESGIETIGDLLYCLPRKYIDRSTFVPIKNLSRYCGKNCTVVGTITKTQVEPGRKSRFRIQVTDTTGSFEALWFQGITYYRKMLVKGKRVLLYGKVTQFYKTCQMVHPLLELIGAKQSESIIKFLPQYPVSAAMRGAHIQQKTLQSAIEWLLKNVQHYPQLLPEKIERKKEFPPLAKCLTEIHIPSHLQTLPSYYNRLRYEELYQLALMLRWNKRTFALPGRSLQSGDYADIFTRHLSFTLTPAQQQAIDILFHDINSPNRMHRLLQGDVGAGKTVVAFFACLPSLHEGLQVAWAAPTEVLAQQTFSVIEQWLTPFGIKPILLKSGIPSVKKQQILEGLRCGTIRFAVGTHALFQESVAFSQLGIIIIDEQHKFGAEQRLSLQKKDPAADFLLLSATPIPQTLAQTLYGDLNIVTIRSVPKHRQKISTHLVPEHKRHDMEQFILKEITENDSQAFYVVPRIDTCTEEEAVVTDVSAVYERMKRGAFAHVSVAALHGKMSSAEKEEIMNRFVLGSIKVLIATTVVEVGIDVPNATVMVIENAERFGLSQLHQLRGRVGRGLKKAYTFLLTPSEQSESVQNRLKKFCVTHDGFEIADLDLSLRGPGDVVGFRQSGWSDLRVADILRDGDLFREIQEELDTIVTPDAKNVY